MRYADVQRAAVAIVEQRRQVPAERGVLVAVSGIDGSGKGVVARRLMAEIESHSLHPYLVGLDAWHEPPSVRFDAWRTPLHFYEHAFRWNALFDGVIEPLRRTRSVDVTLDVTRLPEDDVHPKTYVAADVDVIVLEGIFLLKRELRGRYDLAFWVACSFATALRRAVGRNQEGLAAEAIVADYNNIYFPAQRIHLERDAPQAAANSIIDNDDDGEA